MKLELMLVKKALAEAVKVLYLDDNSDYGTALWKIVEYLGGTDAVELLENDEEAAYKKYVEEINA
jgi:hypothetical protein